MSEPWANICITNLCNHWQDMLLKLCSRNHRQVGRRTRKIQYTPPPPALSGRCTIMTKFLLPVLERLIYPTSIVHSFVAGPPNDILYVHNNDITSYQITVYSQNFNRIHHIHINGICHTEESVTFIMSSCLNLISGSVELAGSQHHPERKNKTLRRYSYQHTIFSKLSIQSDDGQIQCSSQSFCFNSIENCTLRLSLICTGTKFTHHCA